eukprot:c8598_g1_i1.p1 GENE.c8598_g1_i1~~c8598_g1_i1.p1  ORF type:complete len:780 (-),score=215.25 c8598_g1_i1:56-2179(-)
MVNLITFDLLAQLGRTLTWIDHNATKHNVKLVVFHSSNKHSFLHGFEPQIISDISESIDSISFIEIFRSLVNRITKMPLLTVAAITAPCFDAGFEIALACSFRICCVSTLIGFRGNDLGLPPLTASQTLPPILGFSRALDILLLRGVHSGFHGWGIGTIDLVIPIKKPDLSTDITEPPLKWFEASIEQKIAEVGQHIKEVGTRGLKMQLQRPLKGLGAVDALLELSAVNRAVWWWWIKRRLPGYIPWAPETVRSMLLRQSFSLPHAACAIQSMSTKLLCHFRLLENQIQIETRKTFGTDVPENASIGVIVGTFEHTVPWIVHALIVCRIRVIMFACDGKADDIATTKQRFEKLLFQGLAQVAGVPEKIASLMLAERFALTASVEDVYGCDYLINFATSAPATPIAPPTKSKAKVMLDAASQPFDRECSPLFPVPASVPVVRLDMMLWNPRWFEILQGEKQATSHAVSLLNRLRLNTVVVRNTFVTWRLIDTYLDAILALQKSGVSFATIDMVLFKYRMPSAIYLLKRWATEANHVRLPKTEKHEFVVNLKDMVGTFEPNSRSLPPKLQQMLGVPKHEQAGPALIAPIIAALILEVDTLSQSHNISLNQIDALMHSRMLTLLEGWGGVIGVWELCEHSEEELLKAVSAALKKVNGPPPRSTSYRWLRELAVAHVPPPQSLVTSQYIMELLMWGVVLIFALLAWWSGSK